MLKFLKRIDERSVLMSRMARAVGIDVGEAAALGRLTPETLRSAVLRCTDCAHGAECTAWLATKEAQKERGAEAAPGYCRNRGLFAALR